MRDIGDSRFANLVRLISLLDMASSQIRLTNDTGSTGSTVRKKVT